MNSRPRRVISATATTLTREVSLSSMMNSLPTGGRTTRTAWGRHHIPHGLEVVHAQAPGSFHLPSVNALDAGAEDLAHVGAVADHQPDDGKENSVGPVLCEILDVESRADGLDDHRGGEIPPDKLDEQRDAAHDFNIE